MCVCLRASETENLTERRVFISLWGSNVSLRVVSLAEALMFKECTTVFFNLVEHFVYYFNIVLNFK